MADPQELRKQLEDLNKEFEQLNKTVASVASQLGKGLSSAVINAEELTKKFSEGENITKKVEAQLLKSKKALEANLLDEIKYRAEGKKRLADKLVAERQILYQLDNQLRTLQKINEEYQRTSTVAGHLKNKLKDISKSVKDFVSIGAIFKIIIDSGLRFNKVSVDISKNLGYGADNANRTTKELVKAAQSSDNLNFTLQNAADAMNELNTATGLVAEYSADALGTQIMLTKQFGLTADEAAGIYKFSVLTGKSSKAVNDAMVGAFVATRNTLKVGAPFKATIAEAAKVSGQLAANLQNNPASIVKAIVQAKALGTSLEQVKNQGEALLNFETSIENELKAELITGQELNLERARAAALMGDQVTLAKELSNQGMTLEKFQGMNVIAQKSFAEALGLSADQLADQLQKQKLAKETGKSLAQITKDEALEAQKRQDIQTKFNQAILKLQDLIGNLVSGPMAAFIEGLSNALDIIGKIFSKFGSFVELIKNILPEGLSKAIGGLASIATIGALTAVVAKSLTKGTLSNPMITKDASAAGGGGDLLGGGVGRLGRSFKAGGMKGVGKMAGKMLSKGLKGNALTALAMGGIEAGANISEGKGAGESIGRALVSGLFSLGGGALGSFIAPGVGTVGGGIAGGALGGKVADAIFGTADDMIGYGARTLITPTGNVALNNNDTVIAGTNLFKGDDVMSFPKGALNMGGDMSELIKVVKDALTRPAVAYIPEGREAFSKQIATSAVQGSYKAA